MSVRACQLRLDCFDHVLKVWNSHLHHSRTPSYITQTLWKCQHYLPVLIVRKLLLLGSRPCEIHTFCEDRSEDCTGVLLCFSYQLEGGLTRRAHLQMEGFGTASLLTAAEERKLGRQLQSLITLEVKRDEAIKRLGRQISSGEWMAMCEITDAKTFKKTIKVDFSSQSQGIHYGNAKLCEWRALRGRYFRGCHHCNCL